MTNKADTPKTTRKIWNYTPQLPISTAPYFDWPAKPVASIVYLLKSWNPVGWRCLMFLMACATWYWFTPDISRAAEFHFDWIFEIWLRNLAILIVFAGGLHLLLHTLKRQGDDYRYDMRPMAKGAKVFYFKNQVYDNMIWTLGPALLFWTLWESFMYWAYANGWATFVTFEESPFWFVVLIVLLPIWAGFYFYWQHRLFHVGKLYTWVHSWHHKNINTGPWSGLAMHPVESFVLFTDTLLFLIVASHPIHVIFLQFHHGIGAPVSHAGFENLKIGKKMKLEVGDFFHQLHHKFFDCNYGTWETPWDEWFNTFHDGTDEGNQHIMERRRKLIAGD